MQFLSRTHLPAHLPCCCVTTLSLSWLLRIPYQDGLDDHWGRLVGGGRGASTAAARAFRANYLELWWVLRQCIFVCTFCVHCAARFSFCIHLQVHCS